MTLSFGGQRQRIAVPFAAVEAFADPAVELELRFADPPEELKSAGEPASSAPPVTATADPSSPATDPPGGDVIPFGRPRRR